MLLTFFLVTTSMDVDRGLVRQLPPLDDDKEQTMDATEVSRDNTLSFRITAEGKLLMNDKPADVRRVRGAIASFVRQRMAQHVIYVDADPAADYNSYFQLENEIVAAYAEVRDAVAQRKFHRPYAALADAQKKTVREMCPQHISETYNTSVSTTAANADAKKGGEE